MAKTQFQPVPQVQAQVQAFQPMAVKTWLAVFPVTAFGIIIAQPLLSVSVLMAVGLMVGLAAVAMLGVANADMRRFNISQMIMGIVAPVQLALTIWVSVYAGHALAGESLVASTLAAFATFAVLLLADFGLSVLLLLLAGRGSAVAGISVANLIAGKYAGLLGRVV